MNGDGYNCHYLVTEFLLLPTSCIQHPESAEPQTTLNLSSGLLG